MCYNLVRLITKKIWIGVREKDAEIKTQVDDNKESNFFKINPFWLAFITIVFVVLTFVGGNTARIPSTKADVSPANLSSFFSPSIHLLSNVSEFKSQSEINRALIKGWPVFSSAYQVNVIKPQEEFQWVEVSITNTDEIDKSIYIYADYANLGSTKIYKEVNGNAVLVNTWGNGEKKNKGYDKSASVKLDIKPGETQTYGFDVHNMEIRYYSLFAIESARLIQNFSYLTLIYTIFNSIHLIMILFGVVFVLAVKITKVNVSTNYILYYVGYLFCTMFYIFNSDGSTSTIIPQNLMAYNYRVSIGMMGVFFYIRFIRSYFEITNSDRLLSYTLLFAELLGIFGATICFFISSEKQLILSVSIILVMMLVATTSACIKYFKGDIKAQYLIIAWAQKCICLSVIPLWIYADVIFDLALFQLTIRISWIFELLSISAAICMKLKFDYEGKIVESNKKIALELKQSNEAIVVRGLIHDIKTPIANMRNMADQLIQEGTHPDTERKLNIIRDITWDALHQIMGGFEKVRTKSGGGGGKIKINEFCPFDLSNQLKLNVSNEIHAKNIDLKITVDKKLKNTLIRGDETRIFIVLENALLESIYQEDCSFISLNISKFNDLDANQILCVIEDDSGHLRDINIDNDTYPIDYAIENLTLLGGYEITGGNHGEEYSVMLYIPVEEFISLDNESDEVFHVLIIEDQHDVWDVIKDNLKDTKLALEFALTKAEALYALNRNHYDIIVADGNLADGKINDLIVEIRRTPNIKDCKVICYSADESVEFIASVLNDGANSFVGKSKGINRLRQQLLFTKSSIKRERVMDEK